MKFCEELKAVRDILHISQEQLAREIGVSFATINRLEKDKTLPSYATLQAFEAFCKKNGIILGGEKND